MQQTTRLDDQEQQGPDTPRPGQGEQDVGSDRVAGDTVPGLSAGFILHGGDIGGAHGFPF